ETAEPVRPEALIVGKPVVDLRELFGHEAVPALAPLALLGDEPRVQQDAEVLRDGRAAHSKVAGNRVDRTVLLGQQIEDAAANRVADRREDLRSWVRRHTYSIGKQILTRQGEGGTDRSRRACTARQTGAR